MPPRDPLTSLDNPRVKAVVRLREHRERKKTGLFVAEGEREIARALGAGLRPREVYVVASGAKPQASAAARGLAQDAVNRGASLWDITEPLLHKMAYCENPEPILAVFEQPVWKLDDFPNLRGGGSGVASPPPPRNAPWLVAVGMEKPGNLGAMARSALAAGCAGLLVADGVVDAFNPNAIRAGTGAVFSLPIVGGSSDAVLAALARAKVKIFAAAVGAKLTYTEANLTGTVALVIGAEDKGLPDAWLAAATPSGGGAIGIPMHGPAVDSLNASVTAGILLFEALRQRQMRPVRGPQ